MWTRFRNLVPDLFRSIHSAFRPFSFPNHCTFSIEIHVPLGSLISNSNSMRIYTSSRISMQIRTTSRQQPLYYCAQLYRFQPRFLTEPLLADRHALQWCRGESELVQPRSHGRWPASSFAALPSPSLPTSSNRPPIFSLNFLNSLYRSSRPPTFRVANIKNGSSQKPREKSLSPPLFMQSTLVNFTHTMTCLVIHIGAIGSGKNCAKVKNGKRVLELKPF